MRSEARKVHDLFFDILKIAFPDTDFRESKSALTFTGQVAASVSSPKGVPVFGQPKKQKQILEVDMAPSPTPRSLPRGSPASTVQRETRLGNNSTRDSTEPTPFTHPGELVINKKKRKDREKSAVVKSGSRSGGSVSPTTGVGREIRSPGQTRLSQGHSQSQQGWSNNQSPQQGSGNSGGTGWANPVKRVRTDTGKRRPSHL